MSYLTPKVHSVFFLTFRWLQYVDRQQLELSFAHHLVVFEGFFYVDESWIIKRTIISVWFETINSEILNCRLFATTFADLTFSSRLFSKAGNHLLSVPFTRCETPFDYLIRKQIFSFIVFWMYVLFVLSCTSLDRLKLKTQRRKRPTEK